MKAIKYIVIFTMLLFLFATNIFCEVPDSCLTLYCRHDGISFNPDFICIDTCKDSPTYGDWYQRGTWTIGFKKFILRDSIKNEQIAHLKDIDSVRYPVLFSAFKTIEEKFGEFTFVRDYFACPYETDSSYFKEPCLNIFFNRRNRTKDVEYYLYQLPEIRFVKMTNYPYKSDIPGYCLSLYCPNDGNNYNPDLICIDTCKDSPTYGDWYQSGTWTIGFKKFIMRDSLKRGHSAYIKDIDSINFPEFYSAFKIIEDKFGFLTFHRASEVCNNRYDYTFYIDPCLNIFFDRRSRTKDIEYYLQNLPDVKFVWMTNFPVKSDIIENRIDNCLKIEKISNDKLLINYCGLNIKQNNKLSIFNLFGEEIIANELLNNSTEIEIDISSLNDGIYFLKIHNKVIKFIILR